MAMTMSRAGECLLVMLALSAASASPGSPPSFGLRRLQEEDGCKCNNETENIMSSNCTCNLSSSAKEAEGESDAPAKHSSDSESSDGYVVDGQYRARVIVPQVVVNIFCMVTASVILLYVLIGISEKLRRPRCLWKERPTRVSDVQAIQALPSRVHVRSRKQASKIEHATKRCLEAYYPSPMM